MIEPLKFSPILQEKEWGGRELETIFGRENIDNIQIGESWELSGIEGEQSEVSCGSLEENELGELIEVYMEELVGDAIYKKYGNEFPLHIKLINTADEAPLQLHPSDEAALDRHHSYGNSKLWYVLEASEFSQLYIGFNQKLDKQQFSQKLFDQTIFEDMNPYDVKKGDIFYIPSGVVHALGANITLLEVGQNSDITYNLFGWEDDVEREFMNKLCAETVDFAIETDNFRVEKSKKADKITPIKTSDHYSISKLEINNLLTRDYFSNDSFVVLTSVDGTAQIEANKESYSLDYGETILIPAIIDEITISGTATILETTAK